MAARESDHPAHSSSQQTSVDISAGAHSCTQDCYIDEDGRHIKIEGWYHHSRIRTKRYLVKFWRPDLPGRSTHALLDRKYLPKSLLSNYLDSNTRSHDISHPSNQGGSRIRRINQILRPLDMAWYSPPSPDCTASRAHEETGSTSYQLFRIRESQFYDFFILLEWRDDDGSVYVTWEFGELLMRLMSDQEAHCIYVLGKWAQEVETRHDELLHKVTPSKHIDIMDRTGWQYM